MEGVQNQPPQNMLLWQVDNLDKDLVQKESYSITSCCCLVTESNSFAVAHQAPLSMGFPRQE